MNLRWLILSSLPALLALPAASEGADIAADPPGSLSVTVYRAPGRESGQMDLDHLEGFALVTETRTVRLPAGESRLRFEGVAEGIEPASAIVTGLPGGVVEKNRDAQLLSPSALVAASVGKRVMLVRTHARSGKTQRVPGRIVSDSEGVVFQSEEGVEALRCSGLSEDFSFESAAGLSAHPTLSVLVRTPRPITAVVTLSYLSLGFDWAANYTATLSADARQLDLGAWITLANANDVSFASARTQVVAGKVNRDEADEPAKDLDTGRAILARCWPLRSTSDPPELLEMDAAPAGRYLALAAPLAAKAADMLESVIVTGARVTQEQLGDLKLYRLPEPTTVASRQSKQVRLLDRFAVPVQPVYGADLQQDHTEVVMPASLIMRTRNDAAHHLGLPLPSGRVAVFAPSAGGKLLLGESDLSDLTLNEEVEIQTGASPDVQVRFVTESASIDPAKTRTLQLVPGVIIERLAELDEVRRIEVSNARASAIHFEARVLLDEDTRIARADHPLAMKHGRPVFRFAVPAHRTVTVRYQTLRE